MQPDDIESGLMALSPDQRTALLLVSILASDNDPLNCALELFSVGFAMATRFPLGSRCALASELQHLSGALKGVEIQMFQ